MKVAVIGSNGQLGSDVCKAFLANGDEVVELNHDRFDICDIQKSRDTISGINPELVINTAAFHHVDKCETEVARAFEVNAGGARNMAILSNEFGFVLHHISTDYVFDGKKITPYTEEDCVCPINVYGNSKSAGEFFVKTIAPKSLIIRVSGIYGKNPCRGKGGVNFVNLMLRFAKEKPEVRVVNSEIVSPTYTGDIGKQLVVLSRSGLYGICHCTSEGSCSWYEFAKEIFRIKNISTPLNVAGPGEYPVIAPRPDNSVLENTLLKKNNLNVMRHWKEGLEEYLKS